LLVAQGDDDAPGPVAAAAKVYVVNGGQVAGGVLPFKHPALLRVGGHARRRGFQHDQQRVVFVLHRVGGGLLEVEHQAGAVFTLGDVDGAQVAVVDVDARLPGGVGHAGQVQRNARRGLDDKADGLGL